jgi:hypothetical protein
MRNDVKDTGLKYEDWIHLAQDTIHRLPLLNTVMNVRAARKEGNALNQLSD